MNECRSPKRAIEPKSKSREPGHSTGDVRPLVQGRESKPGKEIEELAEMRATEELAERNGATSWAK